MPHRPRSMRWRIASAYIVLIIGTLVVLALVLYQLLRTTYVRTLEAGGGFRPDAGGAARSDRSAPRRAVATLESSLRAGRTS